MSNLYNDIAPLIPHIREFLDNYVLLVDGVPEGANTASSEKILNTKDPVLLSYLAECGNRLKKEWKNYTHDGIVEYTDMALAHVHMVSKIMPVLKRKTQSFILLAVRVDNKSYTVYMHGKLESLEETSQIVKEYLNESKTDSNTGGSSSRKRCE
jgi:hypothetical protein